MHRQGNPSGAVTSIPADAFTGACHGLTIYPAQVAVNPVVAVAAVVAGLEDKLSAFVGQSGVGKSSLINVMDNTSRMVYSLKQTSISGANMKLHPIVF